MPGLTTVLLVDDVSDVVDVLVTLLKHEPGLTVVGYAKDGREALELVERESPDVVVMDAAMPTLDGIETTKLLKERHPEVKIIGFAASQLLVRDLLEAGADAAVDKTSILQLIKLLHDVNSR